jgi:transcriptional regulator with XRE-family HTH domain
LIHFSGILEAIMSFGLRLKELRTAAGLSQPQLAEKAGMSKGGLAHIEQGIREPAWSTVVALAAALGVDCTAFQQPAADSSPVPRGRPIKGADDSTASVPTAAAKAKPATKRKKGKQP